MEIEIFKHPEYYDIGDRFGAGWYWRFPNTLPLGPFPSVQTLEKHIRSLPAWKNRGSISILSAIADGRKGTRLEVPDDWTCQLVS